MLNLRQPVTSTHKLKGFVDQGEVPPGTIGTVVGRCDTGTMYYGVLFYICPGHRCLVEDLTEIDIAALEWPPP